MIVLGIESSCDETAIAVVKDNEVLAHSLLSQISIHKDFGGVIPEVASRAHLQVIDTLLSETLDKNNIKLKDIDGFAAACGPGLAGGLMIGSLAAKTLAFVYNKPFIAVNHLQGHALIPMMTNDVSFPFLLLLISGGHTQFLIVKGVNKYNTLGTTIDDAIGEAFDKSARLLGLPYPGGREIEALAKNGNQNKYNFPVPLGQQKNCNFSFSGLKTAVKELVYSTEINEKTKADICASLQNVIVKIIINRSQNAISAFEKQHGKLRDFVLSGGVSANLTIRAELENLLKQKEINLVMPPIDLCTDNGVMIAWAALKQLELNQVSPLDFPIKPRWALEDL